MTVAEAMDIVTQNVDAQLQRRRDALFVKLLEDGVDPADSWIFDEHQRIDPEWREGVLSEIRQQLVDALGSSWLTH